VADVGHEQPRAGDRITIGSDTYVILRVDGERRLTLATPRWPP